MKKKIAVNPFEEYEKQCTDDELCRLEEFFAEFDMHCRLRSEEKKKLREDFERAVMYYAREGLSLEKALRRLDIKHLGGFYARPPVLWFALDDAAKVYPLSMQHVSMAVFRLAVYLKKEVVPPLLQMALNFTIKRFPTFATTLKKGFFWHYLDTTKRRFCTQEENDIPCQPIKVSGSGSQTFRVLYHKNRISVEFFHVLTDGTGGMTFLKTLTAEYLRLTGVDTPPDETLWDIDATPAAGEFENAFAMVPKGGSASGFVDKAAVQLSGRLSENRPCRIVHLKLDAAGLKAAASRRGATVTAYLLSLMFIAGKAATDELRGEASIQVPVNMRKFYPSQTVRNFAMYCGIRLPLEQLDSAEAIVGEIDAQLKRKASKQAMSEMLTATENMVNMLKYVPLAVKQPVAKLVYGFLGDKIFTNTLSNLGVVTMPEAFAEHIQSMDFVLGTAITNRVECALVTFGGTATFSITKMTADPSFEEKMYDLLCADGVRVRAEGSMLYEN